MQKKLVKSKKVTLETLDSKIEDLSNLIESLAVSTSRGFLSVDNELSSIKSKMETLDKNIQSTRRDMLDIGDKFVTYHKFDQLSLRVARLEKSKK